MADIALITGMQSIPDSVIAGWYARLPANDDERLRHITHPVDAESLLLLAHYCRH